MMNPSRRRPTCRVYIGGLPSDTQVKDIQRFFKNYARRIDILLKRGFGFIVSKFGHCTIILLGLFELSFLKGVKVTDYCLFTYY